MKRLLLSILTVGLVSAGAFAATRAYFSDQATIQGARIETGRVDLRLTGKASQTFTVENLLPGVWTDIMSLSLYNEHSTTPIKYRFYDSFVSHSESGLYDNVEVIVRHTSAGTTNPEGWPIIYQGKLANLYIDSTSGKTVASSLGLNITHDFFLQFRLSPSAGNQFQNEAVVFDIVADATQDINPGW